MGRVSRPLLALVLIAAGASAAWLWWRVQRAREVDDRRRWSDEIRAVFDTARDTGWVETFEVTEERPLSVYDPRWRDLFGRVVLRPRKGAIGDPAGGWQKDGGDDYAFRTGDTPSGDVEIVLDGWWDGEGSIGAQGAVQAEPPHRLYEAALWRGRLSLVYFIGPAPSDFEILAESPDLGLRAGHYRIVFRIQRDSAGNRLDARLLDPLREYAQLARVNANDDRIETGGGQGLGILGPGASSRVTGMAVRGL